MSKNTINGVISAKSLNGRWSGQWVGSVAVGDLPPFACCSRTHKTELDALRCARDKRDALTDVDLASMRIATAPSREQVHGDSGLSWAGEWTL